MPTDAHPITEKTMPDSLLAWCEKAVGASLLVRSETSHEHEESRVWRLQSVQSDRTEYYVKSHRRPHKWEQEAAFYEGFLPLAPPELQAQTPRLLAARPSSDDDNPPRALLFSALPGVPLEKIAGLSPNAEKAAWEQAGRFLAHLHATPLNGLPWFGALGKNGTSRTPNPPISPVGLILQDLENALNPLPVIGSPLSPDEIALGREALGLTPDVFASEPPVLCQRDASPRNWLADPETQNWVGVLDFEHVRRDVRIAEIARWWDGPFLTRPDLEMAFWTGYGPWPAPPERFAAQLRVSRIAQALAQIKWARAHDDADFERRGHEAAARLLGYNP